MGVSGRKGEREKVEESVVHERQVEEVRVGQRERVKMREGIVREEEC